MTIVEKNRDIVGCTLCGEAVTNPICKDCLSAQMKVWFEIKNIDPKIIDEASVIFEGLPTISQCVKCGNDMTVCRHCFTKEVHDVLIENHPELKEEFARLFNYEIFEEW